MPVSCRDCGATIRAGDLFCAACGSDVAQLQGAATTAASGPSASWPSATPSIEDRLLDELHAATIGEFDIAGELGRGGMACVYLAHDLTLDRKVAIKVMLPAVTQQPGMLERFLQEAKTAAKLGHPNIIPIYAARRTGETLFFVMKFVDGRPLDSIIDELGQLPLDLTRTMFNQVARALDYAHRNQVIHRDVKPANIMVDHEGFAVVTDFGIAKLVEAPGMTISGSVLGTPHYMSPEQAEGVLITGASDQYSLGVMTYEMLTGRRPFSGNSFYSLILAHRDETPTPIRELRPDCPPHIQAVVERMLAKRPGDRFPSLRIAAEAFISGATDDDQQVRSVLMTLARSNPRPIARLSTPRSPIVLRSASAERSRSRAKNPALQRPKRLRRVVWGGVLSATLVTAVVVTSPWDRLRGVPAAVVSDTTPRPGLVEGVESATIRPTTELPSDSAPAASTVVSPVRSGPRTEGGQPANAVVRGSSGTSQETPTPASGLPEAARTSRGVGWFQLGTRLDSIPVVLFVNGESRSVLTSPLWHSAGAGSVHIELRATGCVTWEERVSLSAGDSLKIGYRSPRCGETSQ